MLWRMTAGFDLLHRPKSTRGRRDIHVSPLAYYKIGAAAVLWDMQLHAAAVLLGAAAYYKTYACIEIGAAAVGQFSRLFWDANLTVVFCRFRTSLIHYGLTFACNCRRNY